MMRKSSSSTSSLTSRHREQAPRMQCPSASSGGRPPRCAPKRAITTPTPFPIGVPKAAALALHDRARRGPCAPPALPSRPRAPHLHPLGIPSHFLACLQEFFSLTLSLPLPPSQASAADGGAGRPPCGTSRSPPCGSLPTFVGRSATFSVRRTRMHFVSLCRVHVVPSSLRAVSSSLQ